MESRILTYGIQKRTEKPREICHQGSRNSENIRIIKKIIIIIISTISCAYIIPFPGKSSSAFSSCQIPWRYNSKLFSWCKNFFDIPWKDKSFLRFLIFIYFYFIMSHCIPLVYFFFFYTMRSLQAGAISYISIKI